MEEKKNTWEKEYKGMLDRIKDVFSNKSGRENAGKYIRGLLSKVERKNGWQLSESIGAKTPYALQQFIYRGNWDADELRDKARSYVAETLGSEEGVVVVDETGFLKQGKKSCGVKRQYSGTAGRIENCQIGVFMTYASSKGYALIDRRLYLPEEWVKDTERRNEAGVPEKVCFQTKPEMALEMIEQTYEAGVSFGWVTGDSVYGDYRDIRQYCESKGKKYVLCVSGKESLWLGMRQYRVSKMLENLRPEQWEQASCGEGSKGERIYDWQVLALNSPPYDEFMRCLLVRRNQTTGKMRGYICFAPNTTTLEELVGIAGMRWRVEMSFAETKSEVGLDQYEVRSYNGWYRHITLACLAHAFLTHLSSLTSDRTMQQYVSSSSSLGAFKRGRNLRG